MPFAGGLVSNVAVVPDAPKFPSAELPLDFQLRQLLLQRLDRLFADARIVDEQVLEVR